MLGNASTYRSLRDISQGPSRISRSCLSLVCRGCALCDDAEGSIPARRSSFLHNGVNRSTCEPFELRRPLLAFRSARQRRQLRTDISVYLAHLAKRYDCRVVSESPQRIWLSLWQSHVDKALGALVEPSHEAGARRGCATLAAAQSQSTCSAQHARIAGRAQPAHRVLVGKSARVVERARCQCRPSPTFDWRPRTQPHSARPWLYVGFEPTSVQLARCNSEATTQAPARGSTQPRMGLS